MAIVTKRTVMSLYSGQDDIYSHQVRIVLAEKGVNADLLEFPPHAPISELLELNPYGSVPTLIDRDLVLYDASIIMEYLDERFPHPPLFPVYPVARAEARKMMYRIEKDWYSLMQDIQAGDNALAAREQLAFSIVNLEPVFANKPFFLHDEFSMLDCALAPLLWRFPMLGVSVPANAKFLHAYMERVFTRESFQKSLTEVERQLRAA